MTHRRILSLWFPRLAAERALRVRRDVLPVPFAIVAEQKGTQVLTSLNFEAEAAGLRQGQILRDAQALCPTLMTMPQNPLAEAAFLTVLRRWAGKFSPWVAEEPPETLVIDLTGCAHLYGGEVPLLRQAEDDCANFDVTLCAGIADTPGAAWALARHACKPEARRNRTLARYAVVGKAIAGRAVTNGTVSGPTVTAQTVTDDTASLMTALKAATGKTNPSRRMTSPSGAQTPHAPAAAPPRGMIAKQGQMRQVLGDLPLPALRLPAEAIDGLHRLGLRRVRDIMDLPRAPLARRFGTDTMRRLDQALGLEPEPVTPAGAELHFATRLTFPDPIGLTDDIIAGLDRILTPLCDKLRAKAHGARHLRLEAYRSDGHIERVEVGLARPADHPDAIRPLLLLKLDSIDPGFGIDCLRLEALQTEPLRPVQQSRHGERAGAPAQTTDHALADLIGKLGARLGTEAVTRLHPGTSHIPEKAAQTLAAAWSEPHPAPWPKAGPRRPLILFQRPEAIAGPDNPIPPAQFRWRRRDLVTRVASGPERITAEWWLDDPDWRSGSRDYWRVEIEGGEHLWLYYAHGAEMPDGWFCHGLFA